MLAGRSLNVVVVAVDSLASGIPMQVIAWGSWELSRESLSCFPGPVQCLPSQSIPRKASNVRLYHDLDLRDWRFGSHNNCRCYLRNIICLLESTEGKLTASCGIKLKIEFSISSLQRSGKTKTILYVLWWGCTPNQAEKEASRPSRKCVWFAWPNNSNIIMRGIFSQYFGKWNYWNLGLWEALVTSLPGIKVMATGILYINVRLVVKAGLLQRGMEGWGVERVRARASCESYALVTVMICMSESSIERWSGKYRYHLTGIRNNHHHHVLFRRKRF